MHAAAFIALGTNMPFDGVSGPALLARAITAMREAGLRLRAVSCVWRTDAWPPGADQQDYHNAVVVIESERLTPQALYAALRTIELQFGRTRRERWEPRTLDLDIVAMDGLVGEFGDIALPHPRAHERAFVLAPLAEAAPDWRHPVMGATAAELLAALPAEGYRRVGDLAGAV